MRTKVPRKGNMALRELSHRLVPIGVVTMLASAGLAMGASDRFVEIELDTFTVSYDLDSVQMLDPGRFTINSTTIDHPDVMRFKLATLDVLRPYCTGPDGKFKPPDELFTFGKPDLPVKDIKVTTRWDASANRTFKMVSWQMPYLQLASTGDPEPYEEIQFLPCGDIDHSVDESYFEARSLETNGIESKELYDCKRSVFGIFVDKNDPPSKAVTTTNIRGLFARSYVLLCRRLTGESPYFPPE